MEKMLFNLKDWHSCEEHNWRMCEDGVNCYSYILNNPSYYWSVPGFGFVKTKPPLYFKSFDKKFDGMKADVFRKALINGAISDGLIPISALKEKKVIILLHFFFLWGSLTSIGIKKMKMAIGAIKMGIRL